ncbi:MAG: D-alanyl-D-alanine carboxypeptidase family protein [Candidatus Heteroscillospira sp.]|jgi:D-alanyl-D-alanine carboxypeptidase (penicillin-binding protein 5/6)
MKKLLVFVLIISLLPALPVSAAQNVSAGLDVPAPCAILMEKETGAVLWEKDADKPVPPASVTKVMTILLIVEAISDGTLSLEDNITASTRASSMGGSQIYLKEGETMTARDMLKSIIVSSANDAAVAVAEHLCGTEDSFVQRMNDRAEELGLKNTHFTNCTGLFDDDNHYTSARDVAIISRELISHEMIRDYTRIWMDTVRDGQFGLTNTNKLVRRYEGCTGLKTGFTSLAGHCLSATAERDGVEYIAVVMGASSSDERFDSAVSLLDHAFSNYTLVRLTPPEAIAPVRVGVGELDSFQPEIGGEGKLLLPRAQAQKLEYTMELPERVEAPLTAGQEIGRMAVTLEGETVYDGPLLCPVDIARRSPLALFDELAAFLYGKR